MLKCRMPKMRKYRVAKAKPGFAGKRKRKIKRR